MTCGTFAVVPIRWKQGPTSRLGKLPPAAGFALAFHLSVCCDVNSLRHTIPPLESDLSYLTVPPQSDGAKNSETLSQVKSSPGLERWLCCEEMALAALPEDLIWFPYWAAHIGLQVWLYGI